MIEQKGGNEGVCAHWSLTIENYCKTLEKGRTKRVRGDKRVDK